MSNDLIQISAEEYQELKRDSEFLDALIAYGVDNWDGYELAQESLS